CTHGGFQMAIAGVEPTRYRFTVHDYHKMGDVGILNEDSPVELIEGDILVMASFTPNHAGHVNRFTHVFQDAFRTRSVVHVRNPLRLGLHSEPHPDASLLRPRDDFYAGKFPEPDDVLLLVEIADNSLEYDCSIKQWLYAAAGIPEYWVVDLVHSE